MSVAAKTNTRSFFLYSGKRFPRLSDISVPAAVGLLLLSLVWFTRTLDPVLADPLRLAALSLIVGNFCSGLGNALIYAACFALLALACPPRFLALVLGISLSLAWPIQMFDSLMARTLSGEQPTLILIVLGGLGLVGILPRLLVGRKLGLQQIMMMLKRGEP